MILGIHVLLLGCFRSGTQKRLEKLDHKMETDADAPGFTPKSCILPYTNNMDVQGHRNPLLGI